MNKNDFIKRLADELISYEFENSIDSSFQLFRFMCVLFEAFSKFDDTWIIKRFKYIFFDVSRIIITSINSAINLNCDDEEGDFINEEEEDESLAEDERNFIKKTSFEKIRSIIDLFSEIYQDLVLKIVNKCISNGDKEQMNDYFTDELHEDSNGIPCLLDVLKSNKNLSSLISSKARENLIYVLHASYINRYY
jgi:hypothetical protein